ncbi:MAG: aminopeptidase P family protein [Planctomycetes bacterium]|nr:aminopeptidase P family protein [Planctomycetota bacterium]
MKPPEARLVYAAGEKDANLFYATRLLTPDPYVFLQVGRRKIIATSDLELGRARAEATVDEVRAHSEIERALRTAGAQSPGPADVIAALLREFRVRAVNVPADFPVHLADELRRRRFTVTPKAGAYWESRPVKLPEELRAIEETQAAVEAAMAMAVETLRRAKTRGSRLYDGREVLTSERLRRVIDLALMERNCVARGTIVACGDHGCDPHHLGTGPLKPDTTIIIDVFPRCATSQYFADMTRTVVKGKASPEVRRLYEAVREAQELGISRLAAGVQGSEVHRQVQEHLTNLGYKTRPRNGKLEGFIHGTGHGVGLDLHEAPWLTPRGGIVPEGAVVTVEPGLYYFGTGGVRLEDMLLVTKSGCRNLTRFPKILEV